MRILGLLALLAAAALAILAPAGQASNTPQERAERQAKRAEEVSLRKSEREARRLAREEEEADNRRARETKRLDALLTPNANVQITCTNIVVEYHGFPVPVGSAYAVRQRVIFRTGVAPEPTRTLPQVLFEFDGTEAKTEIPIVAPMGKVTIELRGKYEGFKGHFAVHLPLYCQPAPSFQIEQLHSLSGPFTAAALKGTVGQTVTNETVVTNTGNTPLTFGDLRETGCDAAPVGGDDGSIQPFEGTTVSYTCTHTLTEADATAGTFSSSAQVTGTPPEADGAPITLSSGTVVVAASGATTPTTTGSTDPTPTTSTSSSSSSSSSSGTGKTDVLASTAKLPTLHVPHECVRSNFTVYVQSAGVKSVVFYLNGHKLRTLTSKNARKGTLSVTIDGAKLKTGSYKLSAKITMSATATTAQAAGTRSATVKRCKRSG